MATQSVTFSNPAEIQSLINTVNGYSTSLTTNTLNANVINASSLSFANDNIFGNVNSAMICTGNTILLRCLI